MEEVVPVTNAIKGCPTRWFRDEATGLVTNSLRGFDPIGGVRLVG